MNATYYDQEGVFQDKNGFSFNSGSDTFWVVDTAISYRLPKRYGFVSVGATIFLTSNSTTPTRT